MYETHLWVYWISIAADHEAATRHVRTEAVQRPIGGATMQLIDAELEHAMVAVSGAAHAIDAFYGATSPMITIPGPVLAAWEKNRTPRHARVLETFKRGFDVGRCASAWAVDLAWLYRLRDAAVHPTVKRRPMVGHSSGLSTPGLDPDFPSAASRALQIGTTTLRECLSTPRATNSDLTAWCDDAKRRALDTALQVRDVVRTEDFRSGPIRGP